MDTGSLSSREDIFMSNPIVSGPTMMVTRVVKFSAVVDVDSRSIDIVLIYAVYYTTSRTNPISQM